MEFKSTIFILPGLGNSGEQHWQSIWERKFPQFERIQQADWETPVATDWVETIQKRLDEIPHNNIILVGHSLACTTIALWAKRFPRNIKGAFLVAPSDTEAVSYPHGTTGFTPMPMQKLPFSSIIVTSSDDQYVSVPRAMQFSQSWGSVFFNIGKAGHINAASELGDWEAGLSLLKILDEGR